jgi:hypothetical protein
MPGRRVEAVEWLPSGSGSALVRVRGRGASSAELPVLVAGEHRFESLPARSEGEPGSWRGAYVVPASLEGAPLALAWPDGTQVALPRPGAAEPAAEAAAVGEVIDHAVLAERRARRAESAEQHQARAAADALQAVEALERRTGELEAALEATRDELATVRADADSGAAALRERAEAAESRLASETVARGALEDELDRDRAARETLAADLAAAHEARRSAEGGLTAVTEDRDRARAAVESAGTAAAIARAGLLSLRMALDKERRARRAAEAALAEAEAARAEAEAGRAEAEAASAAAGASLQARIAELERTAAAAAERAPDRLARLAREQAEMSAATVTAAPALQPDIAARLDAAAAALRERTPPVVEEPAAEPEPRAPIKIVSPATPPPRADAVGASQRGYPLLRGALVKLAHDDPAAAGRVIAALLPAQGPLLTGPLGYDLTIREVGTFAVTVADGAARAEALDAPRGRRHADFHLRADALTLAELLAGVDHRIGRYSGRARLKGRRRRAKALRALPQAQLTLTEAARAGALLEPALAWQALAYAVHPTWTAGLAFTVAHHLTGEETGTWNLTARDGGGLAVTAGEPPEPPAATVATSRAAFDRLLRDEPHPSGDRPAIRGDRDAVAALLALIDRARR